MSNHPPIMSRSIPSRDSDEVTDQQPLLDAFLNGGQDENTPRWVIWFDGLRYDTAAALYGEYLTGEIRPVHNHDIGYTGDWATEFLTSDYPDLGLFSPVPLWGFGAVEYDEREHFGFVPDPEEYDDASVEDRLAALGYLEQTGDRWTRHTSRINAVVREHVAEVDGGVIRYVQPHPPLAGLEDLTAGSGKIGRVEEAIESGDLTVEELHDAYLKTARNAFRGAADLISDLPGEVVVTADHGEALYEGCCGEIFHARSNTKCDCLCVVPWITDVELTTDQNQNQGAED